MQEQNESNGNGGPEVLERLSDEWRERFGEYLPPVDKILAVELTGRGVTIRTAEGTTSLYYKAFSPECDGDPSGIVPLLLGFLGRE